MIFATFAAISFAISFSIPIAFAPLCSNCLDQTALPVTGSISSGEATVDGAFLGSKTFVLPPVKPFENVTVAALVEPFEM